MSKAIAKQYEPPSRKWMSTQKFLRTLSNEKLMDFMNTELYGRMASKEMARRDRKRAKRAS